MTVLPTIANNDARRLFLDRHLLLRPPAGPGAGAELETVLDQLGFVQVDSVNTLARAHDLILWSRRGRYRPAALDRVIARRRGAFEHWTHDAAVIPMPFYPMWRLKFARDEARMRRYWPRWRGAEWDRETGRVLDHIAQHGPVAAGDLAGAQPAATGGWWNWHPSKVALEYLWRAGRLAIRHRQGFRKIYDLADRVIPEIYRGPGPDDEATIGWALRTALHRLGFATPSELAAFFALATGAEARQWCDAERAAGRLVEVAVTMADGRSRRSYTTPEMIDQIARLPAASSRVRLLSPFDPALRDRARAERLFGFRYRIEIFTPAPRRQYGYYVFPVLQGTRLIGRLDARRSGDTLAVRAFWPEAGTPLTRSREAGLLAELARIAPLAGTSALTLADDWRRPPIGPAR